MSAVLNTVGGGGNGEGGIYRTTYVGTGLTGSANKIVVSFDFVPKLVMVTISESQNSAQVPTIFTPGYETSYFLSIPKSSTGSMNGKALYVTWSEDGKTLSWYGGSNATEMLNAKDYTYIVTAFR